MSVTPLSTEDQVDLWKLERFTQLGFHGQEIACLLFWGTSPHDVEPLMWRDGRRTTCTCDQALRIVRPLELVWQTPDTLPKTCIVCDGHGCEFCA